MYQKDVLREYILKSEVRVFSKEIKVRLAKNLAIKYDNGVYKNALLNIQTCLEMINRLNIHYPGNANPILYIYIVPDNSYGKLLRMPKHFDKKTGGGKPVNCYDLDGFNYAYGLSQNLLENKSLDTEIARKKNELHELSHIIHSQFFNKNQTICEGFAEALPLYTLGFEELFEEHRNTVLSLDEKQILTVQELLNSEEEGSYGVEEALPNRSCSFRYSYISSYLLVRGCLETLVEKLHISKAEATQKFLEILKESECMNEWLIFDIANAIGISQEVLLNGKDMQKKALYSIKLMASTIVEE